MHQKRKNYWLKRNRSREMVDNVFIKGLYNFDIWNTLNPTQIKLEQD